MVRIYTFIDRCNWMHGRQKILNCSFTEKQRAQEKNIHNKLNHPNSSASTQWMCVACMCAFTCSLALIHMLRVCVRVSERFARSHSHFACVPLRQYGNGCTIWDVYCIRFRKRAYGTWRMYALHVTTIYYAHLRTHTQRVYSDYIFKWNRRNLVITQMPSRRIQLRETVSIQFDIWKKN